MFIALVGVAGVGDRILTPIGRWGSIFIGIVVVVVVLLTRGEKTGVDVPTTAEAHKDSPDSFRLRNEIGPALDD